MEDTSRINISKGSYAVVRDTFAILHIVKITTYADGAFAGIVVKSIEPSSLNTIHFRIEDVEFTFSEKPNLENLEYDYPELWI